MAGIHFDVTATDVNFKATLDVIKSRVESTSKTIENLGSDFDTSSVTQKIATLNHAISQNENLISSLNNQISQWQTKAMEAAASGDMNAFRTITADIEDQAEQIQNLIKETNEYRSALSTIELGTPQGVTPTVESVQFFKTQGEYEYAEQLRQKIEELQAQIGKFDGSDADLLKLKESLSSTRDELATVEQTAAEAAAQLGENLGGRAAEASSRLYELNQAIETQKGVVASLETSVSEAAAELERLKTATENTQEIEVAQSNYDALAANLQNAKNQLTNLTAAQEDAKTEFAQLNNEINAHDSVMVKMLGGYDKYTTIVGKLPQPLQMVITGMNGMTGAAKAFIATPLGAIIGAIVLALQALSSWFNSSAEGQMAFAQISGYVSGVLDQLKEIVLAVGEALYKAFTDPKQAVADLWEAIKTNIVNRFSALGQLAVHVGELIEAAFTPGKDTSEVWGKMQDDVLQLATGVEGLTAKTKEWVNNIADAAEKTKELKMRERQLQRDRSQWSVTEQELENKLTKLRTTAMTGSGADRIAAQKEAKEIVDQIIEQRKRFAQEELDIVRGKNRLTTNADEDYEAEHEAERKLLAIEGERTQMMMRFDRSAASAGRTLESQAESQEKALQRQQQALENLREKEAQLILENQSLEISLMDEGHEKSMKQVEQEYNERKQKLEELAADFRQNNQKAGIETGADGLTDSQRNELQKKRTFIDIQYTDDYNTALNIERQAMNEYLKEYGTYLEKRQAMVELANDKMQKAATEGEKKAIAAQLTRDLSDLDIKAKEKTSAISKLFADMSKKSVAELRSIADAGQQALDFLVSGQWDETKGLKFGITQETFEVWSKSPEKLEEIRKAIQRINDEADNSETAFNKLKIGLDKIFKNKPDTKKFQEGLAQIMEGVQSITQAVSFMSDALSNVGMDGLASGLSEAANVLNSTMQGAQVGSALGLGPWGAAVGAVTSLAGAIGELFDAKHERKIQDMQTRIEALQKSYDVLGDSVEKAYSKDASKMIEQQNEMLERQKVLIQGQIKEEEAKKHTDKDRIKEWKEQIEEINDLIADNSQKAEDAIFGEDMKAAIENFSDAYANAWENGTDRAESAKDTVKNMMKQMVTESIKAAVQSSDSMEKIRKKLKEFYADNVLSDWEQDYVLNMAESLQKELDQQFGWAEGLLSGNKNNAGSESAATVGYTTQLSEDTGTEISGRLTAMIDVLYTSTQLTVEGNAILNSILVQSVQTNEHLDDIKSAYTESYKMQKDLLTKIQKTLKEQS